MIKTSTSLQELRRKIYRKAKTEKHWRFWGLYNDYRIKYIYPKATPNR